MVSQSLTKLISCVTLVCIALSAPAQVAGQPPTVMVECDIVGKGSVLISVIPQWAPLGAARFLELVDAGFYDGTAMFRAINNFLVQFGMSRNKKLQAEFGNKNINDDPMIGQKVVRGVMAFAGSGVNSRSSQIWIAYKESRGLGDEPWETPFGYVTSGMDIIDSLYTGYDDQVSQSSIWQEGYQYLVREFPKLDYISTCHRVNDESPGLGFGAHQGQDPGLGEPRAGGAPDLGLTPDLQDPRMGGHPGVRGPKGLGGLRDSRLGGASDPLLSGAQGSEEGIALQRAGMVNNAYAQGANIASRAAGVAGYVKKGIAEETSTLSQSLGTSLFALVFGGLLLVMVLIIYKAMKLSRTDKSA